VISRAPDAPDVRAALPLGQRGAVFRPLRAKIRRARSTTARAARRGRLGRRRQHGALDLIDGLVRRLFELSEAQYLNEGAEGPSSSVVAVGGYARREQPSDVDLLPVPRPRRRT
jgi:UTP:GlnB (protein PII) uridylyltransferase